MILVTIDLISANTGERETLGEVRIANDGRGTPEIGNYNVRLMRKKGRKPWRLGKVTGFHRQSRGVYDLLYLGLVAAGIPDRVKSAKATDHPIEAALEELNGVIRQAMANHPDAAKAVRLLASTLAEKLAPPERPVRVPPAGEAPQPPSRAYTWKRTGGYEVSSAGDKRFSALFATLPDGRTIEEWYQCDVKGYQIGGRDWKLGKGKPPLFLYENDQLWGLYLSLWRLWALHHIREMQELRVFADEHGGVLCDRFGHTPINQARALSILLNEGFDEHLPADVVTPSTPAPQPSSAFPELES